MRTVSFDDGGPMVDVPWRLLWSMRFRMSAPLGIATAYINRVWWTPSGYLVQLCNVGEYQHPESMPVWFCRIDYAPYDAPIEDRIGWMTKNIHALVNTHNDPEVYYDIWTATAMRWTCRQYAEVMVYDWFFRGGQG